MLDVGLIGLGSDWETCHRQALQKLRGRIRVRSVYAPVSSRADQVAAEFECDASIGLFSLVERSDLRALLLLDTAWFQQTLMQFACQQGKPVYLAGRLGGGSAAVRKLHIRASEQGLTLMPEFKHRYFPATVRLQELIASRLGRPVQILVDVQPPSLEVGGAVSVADAERELLMAWLDWCRYLIAAAPNSIESSSRRSCPDLKEQVGEGPQVECQPTRVVKVGFRRNVAGNAPAEATIWLRGTASAAAGPVASRSAGTMRCEVRCERGAAILESPTQILWSQEREETTESLGAERSEVEVMLDHFCRRVVGGLIPVPTLEDLSDMLRLVEAADESQRLGRPVALTEGLRPK